MHSVTVERVACSLILRAALILSLAVKLCIRLTWRKLAQWLPSFESSLRVLDLIYEFVFTLYSAAFFIGIGEAGRHRGIATFSRTASYLAIFISTVPWLVHQ